MPRFYNNKSYLLLLVVLVVLIDQLSKSWVYNNLSLQQPYALLPGLNLILSFNRGVAFGLLAEAANWSQILLITSAIVVSIMLTVWIAKLTLATGQQLAEGVGLSLILGGAVGNLIDRIQLGYVIDFIDVYIDQYHWYTFNIADSSICVGAALFILASFCNMATK